MNDSERAYSKEGNRLQSVNKKILFFINIFLNFMRMTQYLNLPDVHNLSYDIIAILNMLNLGQLIGQKFRFKR